jgi:hypothetical protein
MLQAKKNTAYYLPFPMVDSATPASFKTGLSPTDTAYYKDGAGSWTSLAITDTASEIGSTGMYEIDLTAAEMNHDQILVKFSSAGAADTAYLIDTRTKLVSDLNDPAAADVWSVGARTLTGGTYDANLTQIEGHALAGTGNQIADGFEFFFDVATPAKTMNDCGVAGAGLTAADVWTYGTRVLTAPTNLTDDDATINNTSIASILTSTGTTIPNHLTDLKGTGFAKDTHSLPQCLTGGDATAANQNTIAGYIDTEIGAIITHLTDIKGTGFAKDTHSLPQCLTAAGFSTHAAVDVWSVVARTLTAATNISSDGATIDQTKIANLDAAISSRAVKQDLLDHITAMNVHHAALTQWVGDIEGTGFAKDTHSLVNIEGYVDDIADVYHADILLTIDGTNTQDEYTVTWFKNGARVTSGITSPVIQVVKRADGTDLVAEVAMSQIGATGSYKYDDGSNRTTAGEAVLVIASATIDAATRSFARVASRDSSA